MRLAPEIFWRMTLAEFRAAVDGHVRASRDAMRRVAWQVSHQLVAAGCDADKVSVPRLLGEPVKELSLKQRIARDPETLKQKKVDRLVARLKREREKE